MLLKDASPDDMARELARRECTFALISETSKESNELYVSHHGNSGKILYGLSAILECMECGAVQDWVLESTLQLMGVYE